MEITFKEVSYLYQPNTPFEHQALKNVSFHIPDGSFTAVIGHTGSGKSTLIQHLNGLLTPTSGEVKIGDYLLSSRNKKQNLKALREKVGVVFQYPEHQLFEETIAKDIAFGPSNFGISEQEISQRIKEVLPAVHLDESLLEKSPFDLSGGQMRRVAIAGVLAMKPEVLVLDEPTAGLDPKGQRNIMDMFYKLHKEKNLTTILVTHSMEDALTYADHVLIMDHGSLYMEGKPNQVFQKRDALTKVSLEQPEIIQFLNKVNEKFGTSLVYTGESVEELAIKIKACIEGGSRHE